MTDILYKKIKDLAEQDRPREKLITQGPRALTDSELLGIIIGSGTRNCSSVDLARQILDRYNNNLGELGNATFSDLCSFKGIGPARAIDILTFLELGRRYSAASPTDKDVICSSDDAFTHFYPILADLDHEEMWILLLDKRNNVIGKEQLSGGGRSSTIVDVSLAMKKAIIASASSCIIAHNHPSGNTVPSQQDKQITTSFCEAGKLLNIPLRDHLIIGRGGFKLKNYYSFHDNDCL